MNVPDDGSDWYKDWFGQDYLKVYPHRDQREAQFQVDFVERILPLHIGDCILDLGCGNGRHALELANRGHLVTCFDLSSVLLSGAKKSNREHCCARFVLGDMRHLPFVSVFDAVVTFFTTFGYFESDAENMKTLGSIHQALKPGGRFLQDYMNRTYVLDNLVSRDERQGDGFEVVQERRYRRDTGRIEKRITLVEGAQSREYFESVRLYTPEEMLALLKQAGLAPQQTFGDFDGQVFGPESPRLIITGTKE